MHTKKYTPLNWRLFLGETLVEMTDTELKELEEEFPFSTFSSYHDQAIIKKQKINKDQEDDLLHEDNQINDDENFLLIDSIPLCCEKNCLSHMTLSEIKNRRDQFLAMEKSHKDVALLMLLSLGIRNNLATTSEHQRTHFVYRFDRDRILCRKAFQFVYCIGDKHLRRLKQLAKDGQISPALHGNSRKMPANALPREVTDQVIQFLINFSEVNGLPNPGRSRSVEREIFLSTHYSYQAVWMEYNRAIEKENKSETDHQAVSFSTFRNIWKQALPYIKIQSQRSDLCDFCQEIKDKLHYTNSSSDMDSLIELYRSHYEQAKLARDIYAKEIKESKVHWNSLPPKTQHDILANLSTFNSIKGCPACSIDMTMHYSFDYAQQIHYPYSSQQRGKEYFISPRKCQIFGVCAEALSRQVLFLTDESESIGKGSQAIISMIDSFFQLHGLGETKVRLHADNCVGQNKNNYVMWYLLWRVMNGLHHHITLSFMVPGHTKFSPDAYFGLFKIKYKNAVIDTLGDLVSCVQSTLKKGELIPQVYGRHLGYSESLYKYRNWTDYLAEHFKQIPKISDYNYFTFSAEKPGWVQLRVNPDDQPKSLFLLKKKYYKFPLPIKYPPVIFPENLSKERQMYLYQKVRPFVRDPKKRDITCPKPE